MEENALMNKLKTLAPLVVALLLAAGVTSAQAAAVHATPQPEAPAVTAKPHLKAQQASKKKHKAAKKKAKGKKKSSGKHTQTKAGGHAVH